MGSVNAWVCACEKDRGPGNKCINCESAIRNDLSSHHCSSFGTCQKNFGW